MLNYRFRILLGIIMFSVCVLLPLTVSKALVIEDAQKSENYEIIRDVEDDLIVAGEKTVTVEGDINGDLVILSSTVVVNGSVEGNIYALAGDVTIKNLVGKSVYVLGGDVDIEGEVLRDVFAAAGKVNITGQVNEDVNAASGDILIDAIVGDDVRVVGGSTSITNTVQGDILSASADLEVRGEVGGNVVTTGRANLGSTNIGGDLVIYGEEENVALDSQSTIQGQKIVKPLEGFEFRRQWDHSPIASGFLQSLWFKTFMTLFQSAGLIMVGFLLFKFAPVRLESTIARMNGVEDFLKSSVTGFLAFPVGTFLAVILLFSIFGWPLLKVLVLLAMLASALVAPISGIWLGRYVLPLVGSKRKYIMALTVGVLIIQIIRIIPIIGWIFYQVLVFAVIGAMLRMQWRKYQVAQNLTIKMTK